MPYTQIEEIGKGGFGVVHRVADQSTGNQFAMKTLIPPPGVDIARARERFDREVRYQQSIDHENVVGILAADLAADPPWFLMPLGETSLAKELVADRSLGGDPRKAIFDILSGLEEVHRRGFVHRDLTPGNVLRFRDGGGNVRYAVSDFGLMAVGQDATSTLTPSGMAGGTPLFRAPECAINFKRSTARSDIYSVGAILHEIFGSYPKRLPHDELSATGPIGPIIEKCTKKNSHRRYESVATLREALFDVLSSHEFDFKSREEEAIVNLITGTDSPNAEQWDRIFAFLDDHEGDHRACGNVYRAVKLGQINNLKEEQTDLFGPLGAQFCDYCIDGTFDFDYCDVLGAKLQAFFDLGDIQLQALAAIAALRLGTSHNRWSVERRFMRMAGLDASDFLAQRIVIEAEVRNIDLKREISHVETSISVNREQLHPAIRGKLTP